MNKIAGLHDLVKDTVSKKFTGIVVGLVDWRNGCRRLVVQPEGVDENKKAMPEESFDDEQIEVIKAANPTIPLGAPKFSMRDIVKDKITRLEGSITGIAYYPGGIVRYIVKIEGVDPKTHKTYPEDTLDAQQLTLVKAAKVEPVSRHGGPHSDVPYYKPVTY